MDTEETIFHTIRDATWEHYDTVSLEGEDEGEVAATIPSVEPAADE